MLIWTGIRQRGETYTIPPRRRGDRLPPFRPLGGRMTPIEPKR